MAHKIQISTIAIFFSLLIAPSLQEHSGFPKYAPVLEYRPKKEYPRNFRSLFSPGNPFAREFEEYFNDTYGFRDLLIRTKNQIDYSLFHRSDKVVIGKDNWLFYKLVVEQGEFYIEMNPPESFEKLFKRMLNLNRILKSKGITMVVVTIPMKNTIYPEVVPNSTARRPNPTGFQRYRDFLRRHPEIITIDSQSMLESLRKSFPVFLKTDFHWNDVAGYYVAQALVNQLGHVSGAGELWTSQPQIKTETYKVGGENRSLALLRPIRENGLFLKTDPDLWLRGEWKDASNPDQWEYRSKDRTETARIPATAMFTDSFADAWVRAGFYIHFSRLYKFNVFDFKKYLFNLPEGVRFLILEQTKTYLNQLLQDEFWPSEVSSEDLEKPHDK